ncbi:MAG: NAD(P)-dependent oxidoreductase [Rhodomicrobium sp.]
MAKIAFLGLGAMGSRMAANLLKAGHHLTVWNRTPEKADALMQRGASLAQTPGAAAEGVDFAISMVRDDTASRDVWLDPARGAFSSLPKAAIGIESSTVSVGWIRELAKEFERRGIEFLEAPVSGSRPQAEAGELVYLVGGSGVALGKAEPILKVMGSTVHHAGPAGGGITLKLSVNALLGIQVAAMGELVGLLNRSGMDLAKAVDIITSTQVCSPAAKAAATNMLAANFSPLFAAELMEKDLSYLQEAAVSIKAHVPLSSTARDVFREAIAEGYAQENMTCVVELYK